MRIAQSNSYFVILQIFYLQYQSKIWTHSFILMSKCESKLLTGTYTYHSLHLHYCLDEFFHLHHDVITNSPHATSFLYCALQSPVYTDWTTPVQYMLKQSCTCCVYERAAENQSHCVFRYTLLIKLTILLENFESLSVLELSLWRNMFYAEPYNKAFSISERLPSKTLFGS